MPNLYMTVLADSREQLLEILDALVLDVKKGKKCATYGNYTGEGYYSYANRGIDHSVRPPREKDD